MQHMMLMMVTLSACGDMQKDSVGDTDLPTDPTTEDPVDADGDGYTEDEDCDDLDPAVNPGATEACDGLDNDCDTEVDEDVMSTFFEDADGDGYGDPKASVQACQAPTGTVTDDTDCDDGEKAINPAADEVCDDLDVDEDCDGLVNGDDPSLVGGETFYADVDGDGHGDADAPIQACELPAKGAAAKSDDCDDTEETVHPGAVEDCFDGLDNDCDTEIDPCHAGTLDLGWDAGFEVSAANPGDLVGRVLSSGDLDADGEPDLVLGVPTGEDKGDVLSLGKVAVFSGEQTGVSSYAAADIVITGDEEDDRLGESLSIQDYDADGYDDLLVDGGEDEAWLYYGPLSSGQLAGADADAVLGSWLDGHQLVADFDGDGHGDIAWADSSAEGRVYVNLGPATTGYLAEDLTVVGANDYDLLGHALEVGDVDGDGLTDLIAGAPGQDAAGYESGRVYVIEGGLKKGEHDISFSTLATIDGEADDDGLGGDLSAPFDHNGDGHVDLAVVSRMQDGDGVTNGGAVYVMLGPISGSMSASSAGAIWYGAAENDLEQTSLAVGGDVDGDGNEDLVIGAEAGGSGSDGAAFVVFGPSSGAASLTSAPVVLEGESSTEAGSSVAFVPDWNGDGQDEIAVGADDYDPYYSWADGRTYVIDGATAFGP